MPLPQGTHLGPYEITEPLGAGGMGEVYKARDTRLDRTVAIKILSAELSGREELRQRFEREARAVSSLNHPHICTLYDIGHHDGMDYLVMEYLEGESLQQRLIRGPLPINQVLQYGIQIADALDKAHRQGVVHRDLKPGNIMLTKSGAKLLDFGLAKVLLQQSPLGLSALPTQSPTLTAAGTILGTFQYMAPEQLEGKEADARADIFAFGAVLYEMAAGQKAFQGKSQASLIAAILGADPPPVSTLQPLTPPAFDRVVKNCLAKEPSERWQTAHDVLLQLQWISEAGSQAGVPTPVTARRKIRERLWMATAAIFLLLSVGLSLLAGYLYLELRTNETTSFPVFPPEKTNLAGGVALSPDGRRLVFRARGADGQLLLWLRSMDALEPRRLEGTENSRFLPFWSPDSRFVGFFTGNKLKKINVSGGPPQTLCTAGSLWGGTWNEESVILFSDRNVIYRVAAAGGNAEPVTRLDASRGEVWHHGPSFLPDGERFLYLVQSNKPEASGVFVASLGSKEVKRLLAADSAAIYSAGHLLFVREQTLMAQLFDPERLELGGEPFPVAERLTTFLIQGLSTFSASATGTLAYWRGGAPRSQLAWFSREGKRLEEVGSPAAYTNFELSPDQKRVAVDASDPQTRTLDILLLDLVRNSTSRFTFDPATDTLPTWSPDGSRIAFSSNRTGNSEIYQKIASGAGKDELLYQSKTEKYLNDWSSDGRHILYREQHPKNRSDLWILPLFGERKPIPFLQTEFDERQSSFSPNVRWIAYSSDESGSYQTYVQPFPPTGAKWQISTNGGVIPRWRPDGKELFYVALDRKLMAVPVKTDSTVFEAGIPQPLFEVRFANPGFTGINLVYGVGAHGQRFLLNVPFEESTSEPITVVLNWPAKFAKN